MLLGAKVPLYNSNGYGSCQVCGTPTPPQLITYFDGKWVCPYHRRRHTLAEARAAFAHDVTTYRHLVEITGSLGFVDSNGTPSPPPSPSPPPGGGGGGGGAPNPGGSGGGENPPPDTPPDGLPPGFKEGNLCLTDPAS